jgi:hypothetical protein
MLPDAANPASTNCNINNSSSLNLAVPDGGVLHQDP